MANTPSTTYLQTVFTAYDTRTYGRLDGDLRRTLLLVGQLCWPTPGQPLELAVGELVEPPDHGADQVVRGRGARRQPHGQRAVRQPSGGRHFARCINGLVQDFGG